MDNELLNTIILNYLIENKDKKQKTTIKKRYCPDCYGLLEITGGYITEDGVKIHKYVCTNCRRSFKDGHKTIKLY